MFFEMAAVARWCASNKRSRARRSIFPGVEPSLESVRDSLMPLYGKLSEAERDVLVGPASIQTFAKGEALFRAGDRGDTLYLLRKGHVAIRSSTPLGEIATFTILSPGDVLGEVALLDPSAIRSATAIALDDVEVRTTSREQFERLRLEHPEIDRFLLQLMNKTVRRLSDQLVEALFVPAEKRVLRRVLHLVQCYDAGTIPVTIPLTQDDVASLAGITRETANRILRVLQQEGILTIARGRIEVTEIDRLAARGE